jgi:hypothetical protein
VGGRTTVGGGTTTVGGRTTVGGGIAAVTVTVGGSSSGDTGRGGTFMRCQLYSWRNKYHLLFIVVTTSTYHTYFFFIAGLVGSDEQSTLGE